MRILLAHKFWRAQGGVEEHMQYVRHRLEASGHTVIPFAMREEATLPNPYLKHFPSEVDFRGGSPRDRLRSVSRSVVSAEPVRGLRQLVAETHPDAAYVGHVYHQLGTRVLNELSDAGVPTVLTIHDYKPACGNYRFYSERTNSVCTRCLDSRTGFIWAPVVERCWSGSAAAGLALSAEAVATRMRGSYRKAGATLVLNSLQRASMLSLGYRPDRIVDIAHPVRLQPIERTARGTGVLFVGRLVPEKGVDVLIRAAAASGLMTTIVGGGRDFVELETLARQLEAPVKFLGPVAPNGIADLMREAMAVVVPSRWPEVRPLVVNEATAVGTPVVASEIGGLIDQLQDGRGILVTPNDPEALAGALLKLSKNSELAAQLVARARSYAAEHLTAARWDAAMMRAFSIAGAQEFTL